MSARCSRADHSSGLSNSTAEGSGTSRVGLKRTGSTSIVVGASAVPSISLTSRSSASKAPAVARIPKDHAKLCEIQLWPTDIRI